VDVDNAVDVSKIYAASILRVDPGHGNGMYLENVGKTVGSSMA
jgi:hypothetical protein